MAYLRFTPTVFHLTDIQALEAAVRLYGNNPLVGKFICEFDLTPAQRRRLPKSVRDLVTVKGKVRS